MNKLFFCSGLFSSILVGGILLSRIAFADISFYNMTNTVLAKVRATGGACIADNDGLTGAIYNPASIDLYRYPENPRFAFFLNPVGAYSLFRDRNELNSENRLYGTDWLNYAGIIFKGIGFSMPVFSAVLLLTEPLPYNIPSTGQEKKEMISSKGILDCNYDVLALKLKLAEQVAIGASGFLFTTMVNDTVQRRQGTSYGIHISPNSHVSIGVVYYDFPMLVSQYMFQQNRIIDETINVGVNIKPHRNLSFNLDAYNVSEDNKRYTRELHFGAAYEPMGVIALRAGIFREQDSGVDVYSLGLGLVDMNLFYSTDNSFNYHNFAVNYGIQFWEFAGQKNYHHYLTFLLRF